MAFNGTLQNSNMTAAYLDLSTGWTLESDYLYGFVDDKVRPSAPVRSYFKRVITKCSWFSQIPVSLRAQSGTPGFGNDFSYIIPRQGDYMLNTFLRLRIPSVTLLTGNRYTTNGRLRWCRNFMHNLIEDCNLTFNDTQVCRLDNYILDFHTQYFRTLEKRNLYDKMIGSTVDLTGGKAPTVALPSKILHLDLPFFYSLDSGYAIPASAVIFNEIKINFKFRNWDQLLILDNSGAAGAGTVARAVPDPVTDINGVPELREISLWSTFAVVNTCERNHLKDLDQAVVIQQYQSAMRNDFTTQGPKIYEPKFTFAVRALFFGCRNTTFANEWSNYTTASPYNSGTTLDFTPSGSSNVIDELMLNYESTTRLNSLKWDYFNTIVPFYNAPTTRGDLGYGMYSYSLDLGSLDPNGSTNFSKISTVQIQVTPTAEAVVASNGTGGAASGADFAQKFSFVCLALTFSVIQYVNGQILFPFI